MDITPQDEQSSVLGLFSACGSVGFIIGPIIGGHLAEWDATLRLSYFAAGSIFVLNAVLVTVVIPTRLTSTHSSQNRSPLKLFDHLLISSLKLTGNVSLT